MTGLVCCTLKCNLACTYCYEGNGEELEKPDIKKINDDFEKGIEKIIKFIDELYEYNRFSPTKIIWHGGEPTLIKVELLEYIMQDQKLKGHNIIWSMQSNGLNISDQLVKLSKDFNMSIGISLDGLKKHHDENRITKDGKPTYDLIIKNIKKLKSKGVNCGALVTIGEHNANDLIEIYNEFSKNNFSFSFNSLFPGTYSQEVSLNEQEYADALCNLFDVWIEDEESNIMINPFETIIEGLLSPEKGIPACHWSNDCSKSFIAIDADGKLYPCEHFAGNTEFCFGNISGGLKNELKKNMYFKKRADILEVNDCFDCEIFSLCFGGCPWNGMISSGQIDSKDSSICTGRRVLIKHIYQYLKKYADQQLPEWEVYRRTI
ncbi:radical SAM protein [Zhenpiania hominis]|uniref:radical SAM protein n=1 Tax=Zhenpiania hominis TaxID=2763644 RepID=UPI0039F5A735